MKIRILLRNLAIATVLLAIVHSCGSNSEVPDRGEEQTSIPAHTPAKAKRVLVFMDYDLSEDGKARNKQLIEKDIYKLLGGVCESEKLHTTPLQLTVFPIFHGTGNAQPVGSFSYDGQHSGGDQFCKKLKSKYKKTMNEQSDVFYKKYHNTPRVLKIIDCLDVIRTELSSTNSDKEDVLIVIFSSMLEKHSPTDERIGQFNFLKDGRLEINEYSLAAAQLQLEDENSYIMRKISRFKDVLDTKPRVSRNVFIMRIDTEVERSSSGASYSDVIGFWQAFFKAAGLTYVALDQNSNARATAEKMLD